jgi:hypothetical protein
VLVNQPGLAPGFLLPAIITQAVTRRPIFDWKICVVRTMMRSVVLLADDFATAETFTALRKTPVARAQVEFVRVRVLHTVVSPEHISRWSYPVKRDSKNGVSRTTYRHSADKHLEKSPARRVRDVFVKKFWRWRRIVT